MLFAASATDVQAQQVDQYMMDMKRMLQEAVTLSEQAASASDVAGVKAKADEVFALVWGMPSGKEAGDATGAVSIHGWKTRWQVDNSQFDEAFAERNGVIPPEITDPAALGIMGRGRALRLALLNEMDRAEISEETKSHLEAAVASLNNIIGWMKIDDGVTKGERQPRVDLTREWDAPSEFWLSTADTGWLPEVYSQAINILKVDYQNNVEEARSHAKAMHELAVRCLEGLDANEDGKVMPAQMEGGFEAAHAEVIAAGIMGS